MFNFLSTCRVCGILLSMLMVVLGPGFAFADNNEPVPTPVVPKRVPTMAEEPASARSIQPASAESLAVALDVPAEDILAASLNGSDPRGIGIGDSKLYSFPSQGSTFAILSTGLASSADDPNDKDNLSSELHGLNNSQGNDLVQLGLKLRVPNNRNCLNFDFAYLSEEFPEYVGSIFNDTFTAELGGTNLIINGDQVSAPLNFAFDTEGNIISINTVFGVAGNTGTTYDAGTSVLRARAGVPPGEIVDLVFSVQDLGDSIWDSAVFLDRFFWSADSTCGGGEVIEDTDGDGLLDSWETEGFAVPVPNQEGFEFVDLPAMGANPEKKDIFVEIDYMQNQGICLPFTDLCAFGHSEQLSQLAIDRAIEAFANAPVDNPDGTTGIHLHVDNGPTSVMDSETQATWGSLSRSNSLPHDAQLGWQVGDNYNWSEFDAIKSNPDNFSPARSTAFHYVVSAHSISSKGYSGISRNNLGSFGSGASDFIVSLGSWPGHGTVLNQAGTFMHELGHNLGLRHGGGDHTNNKPNYLSIMSYAFQLTGLVLNGNEGHFDYSRFVLPNLNENSLNESVGLTGGPNVTDYSTKHWCAADHQRISGSNAVDWNCDNDTADQGFSYDVNVDQSLEVLNSYNDWENIVFVGGAIGLLGAAPDLPMETEQDELTEEEAADLLKLYAVEVTMPENTAVLPDKVLTADAIISNQGSNDDTYTISVTSNYPWADSSSVPSTVSLQSGSSITYPINIEVPATAAPGTVLELTVRAVSQANPLIEDVATLDVVVAISVEEGWNLVSFPVYPSNPAVLGVLQQVAPHVNRVLGFEQGGMAFFPDTPMFNTLMQMDALHGYWVHLDEAGMLIVNGTERPAGTPIYLEVGWNLVGYLANAELPVADALASITGKYDKVLGYDGGATSFYTQLPPHLNTLATMQRGKGYWIHMTEVGTLDYSQSTTPTVRSAMHVNRPQSSPGVANTDQWVNVYSMASTYNGQPLPVGTTVTAVGEDGRPLGQVRVSEAGAYGLLAIYGDDAYTPQVDGSRDSEKFRFFINGQPATVVNGVQPTWTSNGDLIQVDLAASGPPVLNHHLFLPHVQQ